ncbi:MAG: TetR/AcrR family transcriptional regulator [Candidatus Hydrogenedentes bacterium]|nr:TetR/AcrR family transcriptional regulator [Candidatus Hydrogenedentota bacterium]
MNIRDRIEKALRRLTALKRPQDISVNDIARESGLSWPTVRRNVGGTEGIVHFIQETQGEDYHSEFVDKVVGPTDQTRARVLEAAFQVFTSLGVEGATMDRVAETAGMSVKAIAWHFDTKEDLALALMASRLDRESNRIAAEMAEALSAGTARDALRNFVRRQVEDTRSNLSWWRLDNELLVSTLSPRARAELQELEELFFQRTIGLAEGLVYDGHVNRDLNPQSLAFLLRLIALGLGRWIASGGATVEFERLAEDAAQLLWEGIAPRQDSPTARGADDPHPV